MKNTIATLILLTIMSTGFAQERPLVTVNGEHTIKIAPDEAEVNFAIVTEHKDLQEAKKENDAIVAKAISFLKTSSIDAKDIRTTRVNVNPYKEYVKDKEPVPMFRAQQSINVHVSDLNKLTDLISGLVDLGVNNIQNIEFKASNLEQLQDEARMEAMLDAKQKAAILAGALGQSVGPAFTIHDNTSSQVGSPRPMMMAYKSEADSSMQDPIATGEIEVDARVTVSFLMK
ncbi:SIMPL domain-containing protein [Albibacterium profundi]|uniref:SIMPL domain-containing protein n=1 Tax=Albibacterium profundi TaxID=3134906 RepID=A0ABV5CEA1_9SPHI